MKFCVNCSAEIKSRSKKYCSNKCQANYQYQEYIYKWKDGLVSGNRGINAKNISKHLRRYLLENYSSCAECGWDKVNVVTGMIPLEVDHIDGNSDNNAEGNLRLLCPNCHSLTGNFRNLNKGNGREWRRKKYIRITA